MPAPEHGYLIVGAERAALTRACLDLYHGKTLSIRQTGRRLGHNYGLVRRLIKASGTPLRPRGMPPGGHRTVA
ncbi:hypothetical protein Val02_66770 [Virgisporangium aliadipatigenens]|uniref:Helix-turn-helix domain-containing protein n=1 Tax=Virgisporangium aliadipatigenens TaxID=741659 RepID=A0A8J3YU03_9ACTN|nr:hypothetical protein [Virgisporangium aliadipatigenens]GIJ49791.1 hypothetical protein Val02_66770 [Virgisporangium aliadipatigenens]